MAIADGISVETLRQLLRLDPETGRLFWRPRGRERFKSARDFASWNTKHAEREAMTAIRNGYRVGRLAGGTHQAHRIVFAMHYGRWPNCGVDHRDGDKSNNRPDNLREASTQENGRNTGKRRRSGSSAYRGVFWATREEKWQVQGRDRSGRQRHIGYFTDEAAAGRAYDDFARREHGEFARLTFPRAEVCE